MIYRWPDNGEYIQTVNKYIAQMMLAMGSRVEYSNSVERPTWVVYEGES